MLSTQAFNALLKTLEEPPAHVKFIFATTEAHKVLPTILSRCQRFDLRPIPAALIASHLLHIARLEGIDLQPEAAQAIARAADGGMRDAQSMLDQLVAFCGERIEEQHVTEVFGLTSIQTIADLAGRILRQETGPAIGLVNQQHDAGRDLQNLLGELVLFFRNLMVHTLASDQTLHELTPEMRRLLASLAGLAPAEKLLQLVDHLAELEGRMKWAPNKKLHLDTGVIRAIQVLQQIALGDVIGFLQAAAAGESPPPLPPAPVAAAPAAVPAAAASTAPVPAAPAPISTAPAPAAPEPSPSRAPAAATPPAEPGPAPASAPLVQPAAPAAPARPDPLPVPVVPDDPGSVWQAALAAWEKSGGGMAAVIAALATPLTLTGERIEAGLPASHDMELELLRDNLKELEKHLSAAAGRPLKAVLTLRNDLPEPETPADELEPEGELADEDDEADAAETPAEEPEDFYNDPLIQRALELFDARIVKDS
jgi:DNA polymerase III subunit gamma/tau